MADPEKAMVVEDGGSDHEDVSSDEEGGDKPTTAASLLQVSAPVLSNFLTDIQDPAVMAALQGKLGAMVGTPSGQTSR